MKKVLLLLIALAFGLGLKAQCPYTQAIDFTATDVHGTQVNLFDILDGGQAVLIDFFYTTCGPCQQAVPKLVESYSAMGCNMHDVFYMEIASGDSEAACLNWVNNYGVDYPTISGVAGGTAICNQYGVSAFPTVILIMPNHEIVIQDLYPIPSAQTVISALEDQGLQQHDCTVEDIAVIFTSNTAITLFPNPANESVTLIGESLGTIRIYNALGQLIEVLEANGSELQINTSGYENGVYFVKVNESSLRFVVTH